MKQDGPRSIIFTCNDHLQIDEAACRWVWQQVMLTVTPHTAAIAADMSREEVVTGSDASCGTIHAYRRVGAGNRMTPGR